MTTAPNQEGSAFDYLKRASELINRDTKLYAKGILHGAVGLMVLKMVYVWFTQ